MGYLQHPPQLERDSEDASGAEQGDASGFSRRSWRCEWLLIRKASGGKEPVQAKRLREGRGKEVVSRGVC